MTPPRLLSIELTNSCNKACHFCYNHSSPEGRQFWSNDKLIPFLEDCAKNGVEAVSFGGGEPLQYPELLPLISASKQLLYTSVTSNGLMLHSKLMEEFIASRPDKVHISLHFPEREDELRRVIRQVKLLQSAGIRSGINFLIDATKLKACRIASRKIRLAGINYRDIVYLPMRPKNTPSAEQIRQVAGGFFQSTACLQQCGKSERFCSIGWDGRVAWCSYTATKASLHEFTYAELCKSLENLELTYCGETR